MNYKEFKKYVDEMNKGIADKLKDSEEELTFYIELVKRFNDICEENAELKKKLSQYHLDIDKLCKIDNPFDKLKYKNTKYMIEENVELEKQLEVGEEQYNDLVEEKEKLEEQLSSITLELEEYKKQVNNGLYSTCLPYKTGYDKAVENYKNQQQEFIKYLTSYIELLNNNPDIIEENQKDILEEVLTKYKEIIGAKDEKDNN